METLDGHSCIECFEYLDKSPFFMNSLDCFLFRNELQFPAAAAVLVDQADEPHAVRHGLFSIDLNNNNSQYDSQVLFHPPSGRSYGIRLEQERRRGLSPKPNYIDISTRCAYLWHVGFSLPDVG